MTLVRTGINRTRDLIADDVTHGTLGESDSTASETNTSLGSAVLATERTFLTKTLTEKTVTCEYQLNSTDSAGTYKEYMTTGQGTATPYNRVTFTPVTHTPDADLIITTSYHISQE